MATKHLEDLWKRGKDFLGVRYALLGGVMTWVSERNLVSAISNAGGFGVIASGAMSPDLLRAEIKATQALTQNPFGVKISHLSASKAAAKATAVVSEPPRPKVVTRPSGLSP